jgi:hypothetical protein
MGIIFHELRVAKSSTGYYVGRFFQEDEVLTQFVRLTDDFSSKQEAEKEDFCNDMVKYVVGKGGEIMFKKRILNPLYKLLKINNME